MGLVEIYRSGDFVDASGAKTFLEAHGMHVECFRDGRAGVVQLFVFAPHAEQARGLLAAAARGDFTISDDDDPARDVEQL